jgi:hypothetical protein
VDVYKVVSRAVEEGIPGGYRRAFKHTDTPTEEQIFDSIHSYVMNELSDIMLFNDPASGCEKCEK